MVKYWKLYIYIYSFKNNFGTRIIVREPCLYRTPFYYQQLYKLCFPSHIFVLTMTEVDITIEYILSIEEQAFFSSILK